MSRFDRMERPAPAHEPIYLIDGYGVLFRSYFAMVRKPLTNYQEQNVSALIGLINTLRKVIRNSESPYLAVCLDPGGKTFRHERYPEYKAGRNEVPEDLIRQLRWTEDLLGHWGLPTFRCPGYEADDLIATVAKWASSERRDCYILSSDKDLLQLVDGFVKILKPEKNDFTALGTSEVYQNWSVYPEQIRDYLALVGDSSDNVPGVKGIGPKGAVSLLAEYPNLEAVYQNLSSVRPESLRKKLEQGRESAFLSYELIGLCAEVPMSRSWPDYAFEPKLENPELSAFLSEIGLPKLAREFSPSLVLQEVPADDAGDVPVADAAPGALPKTGADYECVRTEDRLAAWCAEIAEKKLVALDCETTGLDEISDRVIGISLATAPGRACYIPLEAPDETCLPAETVREALAGALTEEVRVIGQNLKFDYKFLLRWGFRLPNIHFDTMIAAWLLDSLRPVGMDVLAERYLGLSTIHFKDLVPKGKTFLDVELAEASRYAAEDADITWRLYQCFLPELEKRNLLPLFLSLEMPLVKVLGDMELRGIGCDRRELEEYGGEWKLQLQDLEEKIIRLAGETFNLNSTQQLAEILYEKLGLPTGKKTKQGYSTNSQVLEELRPLHPIIEPILEYRTLSKFLSTYVTALPRMICPETGRIHTHFSIIGAATGRLSSKDPNLQNIPIRDELGRKIRSAFKPGPESRFLSGDYSQIELVVLAHLSGDPGLCGAFSEGRDIHRQTGSILFRTPLDAVTAEQRRIAKSINFGVIYGMSAFRLSHELGISRFDAQSFIDSYFYEFAGVKTFVAETVAGAEETGFVSTLAGRHREIIQLRSKNKVERRHGERMAVNTVVQGSAADIVKRAMIVLEEKLRPRKTKLLLQVHDELIFEVPAAESESIERLVVETMENVFPLRVPLQVNTEWGNSWGEIH